MELDGTARSVGLVGLVGLVGCWLVLVWLQPMMKAAFGNVW